jgi:zona occludens toxin
MAVYAYVGRPGAGKSYGVVENSILPACAQGRPVLTNIPLHMDKILLHYPKADVRIVTTEWFDSDDNLKSIPGGTLVVIDEVWRVFPAGQKLNSVSRDRSAFFAEHRHKVGANGLSQDIVLIVQDLTKVAAWARTDVDKTFVATKLDAAGMDNKFRVDIYQGGVKGPKYPEPDLGFSIQEYKPDVYQFYQSHTKGGGAVGLEIKPDRRATVLSHPMVKWGVPVGLVLCVLLIWQVSTFFARHNNKESKSAAQSAAPVKAGVPYIEPAPSAPPPPVAPVREPPPAAPPAVVYSEEWRYIGAASFGDRLIVVIESAKGRRRIDPGLCRDLDFEPECVVDGQRVSRFSGPQRSKSFTTVADLNPFNK